ncbi:MAG: hypothetical protein J0L93_10735 [Deltaproteobacteria bacterium]|nr:hypothetical protein [Deltaproteobacteria bacterium]
MSLFNFRSFSLSFLTLVFSQTLTFADAISEIEDNASKFIVENEVLSRLVVEEGKKPADEVNWDKIQLQSLVAFAKWKDLDDNLKVLAQDAKSNKKKVIWLGSTAGVSTLVIAGMVIYIIKGFEMELGKGLVATFYGSPVVAVSGLAAIGTGGAAIYFYSQKKSLDAEITKQFEKTKQMMVNLCTVYETLKEKNYNDIDKIFSNATQLCQQVAKVELASSSTP